MIDLVSPSPRHVYVLGGHVRTDAMALAQRALESGGEIVLIAVGYPLSRQQQRLVETTVALVGRMHVDLDAILVASTDELGPHIQRGDHIEVLASGLERRRLSRAVDRAVGPLRGR